jgi:serine/threonine protein kinase
VADFGLSRKVTKESSNTSLFGSVPYLDPKSFYNKKVNKNQNYVLNEKSDVYSIGVLMWQISSGRKPFDNEAYDFNLMLSIQSGKRETIIDGTPNEYSNLYTGILY